MEEVCCGNDTTSTPVSSPKTETQPDMELIASNTEAAGSSGSANGKNEKKKGSSPKKVLKALHGVVVPKVEPIKWYHFVALSTFIAIPVVVYDTVFSTMGLGEDWFYYLSERYGEYAAIAGAATAALLFVAYMLDFTDWESDGGVRLRKLIWALTVVGVVALVLLMVGDYPYGPIAVFAFVTPLWLVAIKEFCYRSLETRTFIAWCSGPLFFIALVNGIVWIVWTFQDDQNEWNEFSRIVYADEAGCPEPDFVKNAQCDSKVNPGTLCVTVVGNVFVFETFAGDETFCTEECSEIHDNCLNTFILWVGPAMLSMVLVFLSFFSTFLRSENGEKDILNFGKVWIFLLFAVWLTASLAGIAAGVASALMALTLASFIGSAVFIASSVSYEEGKTHATGFWERIRQKYGNHLDVVRGLAVVMLTPMFWVFLVMSTLNQCIRRCGLPCSKTITTEDERKDFITKNARRSIETFQSWHRSTVYIYAVYWGAAFMIMQVIVAQLTVMFLSWLIEKTSPLGLGAVTGIMVGVGLLMFLLPPVPGVPIYLTLGIVIIATGRELLGIIGCMAYGTAVSLLLKLLACTLQQKMIGENLSNYVSIRQLVGINSTLIRAMKLILQEPGFSIAKVAILVGGPDWPTSVLCGLMRLELCSILLGTTPIFFLILPTLLTGSFTYMASLQTEDGAPEFPYAGVLATVFAAITAIVQFGAMVVAAYYLEQTTRTRGEELDQIPIDEEVREREEKGKEFNRCYKEVTQWEVVPFVPKMILRLSLTTMIISCYMVQLFARSSFAEYQLTYTIDENLDGDWTNILLPLGRTASLLFIVSCIQLYGYITWAGCEARKMMAQNDPENGEPGPNQNEGCSNEVDGEVTQAKME